MSLGRITILTVFAVIANAQTPAPGLWDELSSKRERLPSLHQEFDVTQSFKTVRETQSAKRQTVIDVSKSQWREKTISGSGNHLRLFDGSSLFYLEEGSDEFMRSKRRSDEEERAPAPYSFSNLNWTKAIEIQRLPCGIPGQDHKCVVIEVPVKPSVRTNSPTDQTKILNGIARLIADTVTGMVLSFKRIEQVETRTKNYQSELTYICKRLSEGVEADASLFKLPEGLKEVKELSPWNAARIKKQLVGKTAPELTLKDIEGKTVSLAAAKGKTVLLDFWTTWCPPCREDGPSLDKLFKKYGDHDLVIVGISVSEEHEMVEKFLKQHPHPYSVALTSENEMPRAYQIGVFPTYIVIDPDGKISAATEGEKGFSELKHLLKKAGLETD